MNGYNHYFTSNWDNIKNTWKGLNTILNINNTHSNILKSLASNDTTSAEPIKTANIFNSFFTYILLKLRQVPNIPINTFLIFLKIDLMTLFS